jgi:hypothetical protein
MQEWKMGDSFGNNLAYHHEEIARLKAAIEGARPNSRQAGALRSKLKYHEDRIGRPTSSIRTPPSDYDS